MVEWLAGNRIIGTNAERTTGAGFFSGISGVGGWKEVGRTTLGSAGDTITVSSLADKRYYMVLGDKQSSGSSDFNWRVGNGSADSGNNYSRRQSSNGGAESTNIGYNRMFGDNGGASTPSFQVGYFANKSGKEKFNITHSVSQGTAGAGAAPTRRESVNKWTNTSLIDVIQGVNVEGGDFASGSEVVVLGWDESDTHGTNFWEELASVDTGAGEVLDSGTFAAKKYLWFQFDIVVDVSNNTNATIRFNGDSNGNYSRRLSQDGMATDNTATGQTHMTFTYSGGKKVFGNYFVINNLSNDKLAICHTSNMVSTGTASPPARMEVVGKWANTSSQITQIEVLDTAQGDLGLTSGKIKVWGSD